MWEKALRIHTKVMPCTPCLDLQLAHVKPLAHLVAGLVVMKPC
jgi:hypothetical protein